MARHLAARGIRVLRRMVVVGALWRAERRRARPPVPPPAARIPARPAAGRPGAERHVRRPRVQARRADTTCPEETARRRELLCAAPGLDRPVSTRNRRHRRLHRTGRQVRARVAAAAVGGVAVLDGCAVTGAGGPYRRWWAGMARPIAVSKSGLSGAPAVRARAR